MMRAHRRGEPHHLPRVRRREPQRGRLPPGRDLPLPAAERAALRQGDLAAHGQQPRPGQPARANSRSPSPGAAPGARSPTSTAWASWPCPAGPRAAARNTASRSSSAAAWAGMPFIGQDLFSLVPRDRIARVCRAAGLLFRDHGDRRDRSKSRLKFVVHRKGIDFCRGDSPQVPRRGGRRHLRLRNGTVRGRRGPLPRTAPHRTGPGGHRRPGHGARHDAQGRTDPRRLQATGESSRKSTATRSSTLTNRQNIELHGVLPAKVAEAKAEIGTTRLRDRGHLRDHATSCPASERPTAPRRSPGRATCTTPLQATVRQPRYRAHPGQGAHQHHRLPQLLFAVPHRRHRAARHAHPRGDGFGGRLRDPHRRQPRPLRHEARRLQGRDDCPRVIETVLETFLEHA